MGITLVQVLEFTRKHKGVVMSEWQQMTRRKVCRVVFPTTLTRNNRQGCKSEFIKKVIDEFYPNVEERGEHSIVVHVEDTDQEVLISESNLDAKLGLFNRLGFEFPPYNQIRKREGEWQGVNGIFLQIIPEKS